MLSVSTSLLLILSINSIPRSFLVHYSTAYTPFWEEKKKKKKQNKYLLPFLQWLHFPKSQPYKPQQQPCIAADLGLKQLYPYRKLINVMPLMYNIWEKGRGVWNGREEDSRVWWECHGNPWNLFSSWLDTMLYDTILINKSNKVNHYHSELCFLTYIS